MVRFGESNEWHKEVDGHHFKVQRQTGANVPTIGKLLKATTADDHLRCHGQKLVNQKQLIKRETD